MLSVSLLALFSGAMAALHYFTVFFAACLLLAELVRCGTPATTMSIQRPSLDDVFLSLTGTPHSETESREGA